MKVLGIIPARYGSSRLEGKPLKDICGKPMIQHVYERTKQSNLLTNVIVATDDQRILDAVIGFGGKAQMTSIHHKNGSTRIAEVVESHEGDIIVNIQGDEPLINPDLIDEVVSALISDPEAPVSTLCRRIENPEDIGNPNVVKTVFDLDGNALLFSRSPIPYPRHKDAYNVYEHIGIYCYRRDFLLEYIHWDQTPLEITESLEQLRILEHGHRIKVVNTKIQYEGLSVDTQEDLDKVRRIISAG